ncbi:MAG: pyruvate kinase [Patiriisocius sp.]|jgi:pyruvate kinase
MVKKQTKIIATIGPASESRENLKKMILEGMNVVRLNFSHGTKENYAEVIKTVKSLIEELNIQVGILADLQGPKIRVGEIENNALDLREGDRFIMTTKECVGNKDRVQINYPDFAKDTEPGERIMLDDGKIELKVEETNGVDEVHVSVTHEGILSSNKGVNLPNTKLSFASLTKKDREDLEFILTQDIDWLALSFVRSARDIIELKHIIKDHNSTIKIIAKIEKPEALNEIDEIIQESDGLMVARGDLGVEIPMEQVPMAQKMIIKKCIQHSKPVIVATQMMDSMIVNYRPTRAEVNDVANAVLDGADAVMLSGETSVGKYPILVVSSMTKIIQEIELGDDIYHHGTIELDPNSERYISDAICKSSGALSKTTDAKGIVTMTFSGYTAFKISSLRPRAKIYVFTGNKELLSMLTLVWGVEGFYYDKMVSTDHTIADIKYLLKKEQNVQSGDLMIHVASMPIANQGMTNMLKLSMVD